MVIAGENVNMTVAECSGGICEHMDSRSSALAFVCDVAGGASPGEGESGGSSGSPRSGLESGQL